MVLIIKVKTKKIINNYNFVSFYFIKQNIEMIHFG